MGSEKRWRQLGGEQFHRWDTPGQLLEGIWCGTKPGKKGLLGIMETDMGRMAFGLSKVLADALENGEIKDGAELRITFLGKRQAKNGNEYNAFNVAIAENGSDGPSPGEAPQGNAPDDDEVPF